MMRRRDEPRLVGFCSVLPLLPIEWLRAGWNLGEDRRTEADRRDYSQQDEQPER
jgi:hypothetical protein